METKFNFKSSVCTSRSQSERLLALGLKKETADMCWTKMARISGTFYVPELAPINMVSWRHTPAWSLGRLIKDLMPQSIGHLELAVGSNYAGYYEDRYNPDFGILWEYYEKTPDMFDNIISTIEWLIKEGYFNKEYLV